MEALHKIFHAIEAQAVVFKNTVLFPSETKAA